MQIHEITRQRTDEGILDNVRSVAQKATSAVSRGAKALSGGIKGAQQGYQAAKQNRKNAAATGEVAGNAARLWTNYATRLENSITDPAEKKAFQDRTDGQYEDALRAFIQQNLLKNAGKYENLINVNQIEKQIKDMSAPGRAPNPQQWTQLLNTTTVSRERGAKPGQQPAAAQQPGAAQQPQHPAAPGATTPQQPAAAPQPAAPVEEPKVVGEPAAGGTVEPPPEEGVPKAQPGKQLVMKYRDVTYYKRGNNWYGGVSGNERIRRPDSVKFLDNMADSGAAEEESIPEVEPTPQQGKGRKKK